MKPTLFLRSLLFLLLLLPAGLDAQERRSLEADQPVAQTLAAGESHEYELTLAADWFVSGRVDQDEVAVEVTILGPDGERVARFASPVGRGGPESFRFSTETAGRYMIAVAPAAEDGEGAYRIRLERSEPVATTAEGKIDQALAQFAEDTPGAIVAVIRAGEVDFVRSYGMANLSYDIPFTRETATNIGSTSKQFTGFALALLHHRGELSLDDDVRDYIPELPDFGETVTLHHLLSHTTGYREFVNGLLLGGRQVLEGDYISPDEVIAIVQNQPRLQNAPGAEFNYNNTAFGLATVVVERVTGVPFAEWMDREVFQPLGMTRTAVRAHPGQIIRGAAMGYTPSEGGFREAGDLGASAGAGGIYTTVDDLARWMGNLRTGRLGGPEVIQTLTTSFVLADGEPTNYGLGLFLDEQRGLNRWQHGGSDIAHRSTFIYYPDLDEGYVVLSNYAAVPGSVGGIVAEAFFGTRMESTTEAPAPSAAAAREGSVSTETLQSYAGRYDLAVMPGTVITVSLQDSRLVLQVADQPEVELTSTSDSTFTLAGVDAAVTFHRQGEEPSVALTLHQGGDHRATRLSDEDEEERVTLAQYTGRYFSEELETFYELRIEDDQLAILHRRFGPALLAHSEADTFTGTLPVTELVFERDADGRITGFRAGNGRARDIWFERLER